MKFNKIGLAIILLVVVSSMGIVFAESASVGGHSFTIPDGFKEYNSSSDTITLAPNSGEDEAIVMMITENVKSMDDAKKYLEDKGYVFQGQDTYKVGDTEVDQQNYIKGDYLVLCYVISAGDDYCIITYTMSKDVTPPEGAANPVSTIINTIG